jgi:hypothetical protein
VTVLVTGNYAKHSSWSNQFLTVRRRHGLTLFRRHIRNLWLIRATSTDGAAYIRHTPDAFLICNEHEHKAVPVGEANPIDVAPASGTPAAPWALAQTPAPN